MQALFALTIAFTAWLWACQISVFSGAIEPDKTGHLLLDAPWWHLNVDHLFVVTYPIPAAVILALAAALGVFAWRLNIGLVQQVALGSIGLRASRQHGD